MSVADEPHFELHSTELAAWLERQGVDRWWTVDGDPLLMGRLSLPCPADELAEQLRRADGWLLVRDKSNSSQSRGQPITSDRLDELASRLCDEEPVGDATGLGAQDRFFVMAWKGKSIDWMLIEDKQTTEQVLRDAALEAKEQ